MTLMDFVQVTGCTLGTCSNNKPKNKCVTFVRNEKYLQEFLHNVAIAQITTIAVIIPENMQIGVIPLSVCVYRTNYVDYEFTKYHNTWWAYKDIEEIIPAGCNIHPTAVIGEGIRVANGPDGAKLQLKHVGTVVFGNDVYVGPLTLIERGCIDSTVIGNNVKIDGRCCIGHNSVIGDNFVMATGSTIGGSAKIGKDCWVGLDATVLNGRSICDRVIIGAGCVVNKDITESGVYIGVPAKYLKPYVEDYNF